MPPKRPPLVSTLSKKRPDYGTPFQIYTELVNTGKNLHGTKKRVKWRFGWSDNDIEFEVELLHSVVSGKKTILENGKEIFSSSNILATEFSHAWNSEGCNHMFRIDANLGLTSEHTYMFSIDGVNFLDMPRKPLTGTRKSLTNSRYSDISDDFATRRPSAGSVDHKSNLESKSTIKQSNHAESSNTFDPFSSNNSGVIDPFNTPVTTSPAPQKTINFFDDFDDEPTPTTNKAAVDFNAFDSNAFNNTSTNNTAIAFNLFDDNFSTTSSTAATRGTVASSTTDDFYSATSTTRDSFTSLPSNKSTSTAFGIRSQPTTGSSVASSDVFSASNATAALGFDAFAPTTVKTVPKRTSAQDIIMDFEGLTVTPIAVTTNQTPIESSKDNIQHDDTIKGEFKQVESEIELKSDEPAKPKDPWSTGLVNLDLSKHGAKTATSASKPSIQSSPPLKAIVAPNTSQSKPAFNTPPPAPLYANPPQPNSYPVNPFAMSPPNGSIPPRNPFGGTPNQNPAVPIPPYDPFMTIQPIGGLNQYNNEKKPAFNNSFSAIGQSPQTQATSRTSITQVPKSSLDTIDWRN
eukprot:CAMPEP_0196765638 /NCGR_PEP_ID=MMETSP1095-20130614/10245_1 /TAXON_ID=96789 ORGANISM="Chromulina nebulosa, Strain UTEXLB2642" /NCGR_SAMPLE_ID=MMETSP1095 /ASSEMBLY_ACC=CAM_ASM_000446 /LENGTH=573 /DNA_ID=CAMNT_0042124015 /DNA_START=152 /DNA_END=1873 /DNA_ORIENTATION=+